MKNNKKIIIILIIISVILILALVGALVYTTLNKDSNQKEDNLNKVENNRVFNENKNEKENIVGVNEDVVEDNDEDENLIVSMAVVTFNSQFTSYQGEVNEPKLQELIDKAVSSNEQNPEHQISATSNNLDNITNLDKDAKYIVSFSYDSEGYINMLIVDKKEEINIFDTAIEIQNGLLNSANNAADSYREQLEEEEALNTTVTINGQEFSMNELQGLVNW